MRYVAFHVTNDGPNDVFVAGLGRGCAPFSIAYSDGCPIQDGPGSCAMISNWNYVDTYDRLPPGGEMETNWFGTEWIPYSSSSCTPYGVSVIASPGTYRATFGFERAIPPGCSNADTGNLWYCATGGSVVSGQQFNAQCRTSESVTAEFVLPPPSSTDVGEGGNQAVATVEVHIR